MRSAVFFCCLFISLFTCFAQQSVQDDSIPRAYYDKGILKIAPSRWRVEGYQISLVRKRGDMLGPFVFWSGSKPSKNILDMLRIAQPGDKLYFENVKAMGPDHHVRNINSVEVKL